MCPLNGAFAASRFVHYQLFQIHASHRSLLFQKGHDGLLGILLRRLQWHRLVGHQLLIMLLRGRRQHCPDGFHLCACLIFHTYRLGMEEDTTCLSANVQLFLRYIGALSSIGSLPRMVTLRAAFHSSPEPARSILASSPAFFTM